MMLRENFRRVKRYSTPLFHTALAENGVLDREIRYQL